MKKMERSSELLWLIGMFSVALGVALCSKADLGVSMIAAPAFVLHEFIMRYLPWFTVGMSEYLIQGVMLIILVITVRRFNLKYLLSFAAALFYGAILDLFMLIFSHLTPDAVWLRYLMLLIGDICTAIGVACLFCTYLPLQVYELFVAEISSHFQKDLGRVKMTFDYSLLSISLFLALLLFRDPHTFDWTTIGYASFHSMGLGTLITTLINAPLITLFGKYIKKFFEPTAAFGKLEKLFKH